MERLNKIKDWAKLRLTTPVFERFPRGWGRVLYSQEGEDAVLARLFGDKRDGFYIDVGAHHPLRFSNTAYFYNIGWRGINIDAWPGSMDAFRAIRRRDINLEMAVSDTVKIMLFHIFNEPALNTFDEKLAVERSRPPYHIVDKIPIKAQPLSGILDQYLPQGQGVDFMSVDVEGFDLPVLASNNWIRYRPRFVLAECLNSDFESVSALPLARYLGDSGYSPVAKTVHTVFFQDKHRV